MNQLRALSPALISFVAAGAALGAIVRARHTTALEAAFRAGVECERYRAAR